jgi:hypothetical protein
MSKKLVLALVLVSVLAGGLYAQSNVRNNWVSGEVSILGGGARYERMLGPNFSVGANVYYSTLFLFWNELEVGASGRWYPGGSIFFVEAGLGYHWHSALTTSGLFGNGGSLFEDITGVAISPGLGWKIDVGSPGGFFINPGIKVPITLGARSGWYDWTTKSKFGVGIGIVPYIGLGGAF